MIQNNHPLELHWPRSSAERSMFGCVELEQDLWTILSLKAPVLVIGMEGGDVVRAQTSLIRVAYYCQ